MDKKEIEVALNDRLKNVQKEIEDMGDCFELDVCEKERTDIEDRLKEIKEDQNLENDREMLSADDLHYVDNKKRYKKRKDLGNNDWTVSNEKTVRDWIRSLIKTSFVYDCVLEKKKKMYDRLLIISLIVSSLTTLFSTLIASIEGATNNEDNLTFSGSIVMLFLSFLSTVILGTIKIKNYSQSTVELTSYIREIDRFFNRLKLVLLLPCDFRENAVKFIAREAKTYTSIMNNTPNLYPSELQKAEEDYIKFIRNQSKRYKILQKYYSLENTIIDTV